MLVAALVDLGQGEPADVPDDPAEDQLLLSGESYGLSDVDHLLAVEQVERDGPGREEGDSSSSRTAAGDRSRSRAIEMFQVAATVVG